MSTNQSLDDVPPTVPSGWLGHDGDIEALVAAIEANRVVTLHGPVGVGKSRLASEVCRRWPATSPVRFIALTGSAQPAAVAARLDAALSAPAGLVVIDAADRYLNVVADVLGDSPAMSFDGRVLVTSERLLGLPGERVWPVKPLACPGVGGSREIVASSASGELFLARTRLTNPAFDLHDDGVDGLAELCRCCDGLPLALETLAGWVGSLSLAEIVERRDELLDLRTTSAGPDGVGAFYRAVADSYARVPFDSQQLASRLSVFVGSFTVEDATAVTAMAPSDVILGLRSLVECSWLTVDLDAATGAYRMLAPLRRFALSALVGDGKAPEVRARHARHFAALARSSETELVGIKRADWVTRMSRAGEDLEAALTWTLNEGDRLLGLGLATSLWLWWLTTGRLAIGRSWLERLTAAVDRPPVDLSARSDCAIAVLAVEAGDYEVATRHAMHARACFAELADLDGVARADTVLGSAERYLGRYDTSRRHFEAAMAGRRTLGDDRGVATALNNLALVALDTGDLVGAREIFAESLLVKRRLNEPRTVAIGLANLSDVLIRAGLIRQAQDALFEAAEIATGLGDSQLFATIAANLGDAAVLQGDYGAAIGHYQTSLDAYAASGGTHDVVPALCGLAQALRALGRTPEAVIRLREAEALAAAATDAAQLTKVREALVGLGHPTSLLLPDGLTARQAEILRLLATGASNQRLATNLQISVSTVERHLSDIYRKLGIASRVEATRYALDRGLVAASRAETANRAAPEYLT